MAEERLCGNVGRDFRQTLGVIEPDQRWENFKICRIWTTAGDPLAAFRSLDQNRDDRLCLNEFRNRPDSDRPNGANDP